MRCRNEVPIVICDRRSTLKTGGVFLTKVVAINGSPDMEKGNTAKILTPFLEGMEEAGASVELFYAKRALSHEKCLREHSG
jgi:hypothetical protein